jgi:molybdopterin-containing oxidoreductase family iron-sulfur binding subunit
MELCAKARQGEYLIEVEGEAGHRTSPLPLLPSQPRDVSRRDFLGRLGAAGAYVAFGGGLLQRVLASQDLDDIAAGNLQLASDHQWVMVFDLRRCDGCRDCIKGCQEQHHLSADDEWIKVYDLEDVQGKFTMPVLCMQCEAAPCVRVCPSRATYHRSDGVVVVDQNVCIGCRMCMAACPYDVRVFNWEEQSVPEEYHHESPEFQVPQKRGTVSKCTLCVHLLEQGQFPACVQSCTMEAIFVGDLVEDVMSNGRETYILSQYLRQNDAFRFRSELGTRPRVYYVSGHGQDLEF